jgi:hypothetical protein
MSASPRAPACDDRPVANPPTTAALDRWLPDPTVRTLHRRRTTASPEALWDAARSVTIGDTLTLRPLIMLRLRGAGPTGRTTFRELFDSPPFVLLEEGARISVSGLAGRLWTLDGGYADFAGPDDYRAHEAPGTAMVALATAVIPAPGGAEIVNESRVWCVDRRATIRFRPYWAIVGPLSRFIGLEVLHAATRRAERTRA